MTLSVALHHFRLVGTARLSVSTIIFATTLVFAAPALLAQNAPPDKTRSKSPGIFEKATYSYLFAEFGGGIFSPQHSTANAPTQNCLGGTITTNLHYNCAEQFSQVASGAFGLGVRPIRYLEAGVRADILGNFGSYPSGSQPFQCVSGCTGTGNAGISTVSGLVSVDGKGVLPLFGERLLISAGGGVAWLAVHQEAQSGGTPVQGCYYCAEPQRAHGLTEVADILYFPDRHFGIGLQFRNVQISTPTGLSYAAGPLYGPITYKDRFFLISGEISLRWGKRD